MGDRAVRRPFAAALRHGPGLAGLPRNDRTPPLHASNPRKAKRRRKMKMSFLAVLAATCLVCVPAIAQQQSDQEGAQPPLGFFITSTVPATGNLGGLEGADRICQDLAEAAGAGDRTWRAYLSTQATETEPAVNARDRIGSGPWHNAAGELQIGRASGRERVCQYV